ncbi:hypothetical protein NVP1081O_288 [Vibrio phage 1.081.O._10N.286.52.C2]|nr:hypothetical protein NVP1081O_288 [Vibrio phage 1.081.O._10N.286.52.C2]
MSFDLFSGIPGGIAKPKFIPECDDHQFFDDCRKLDWLYYFSDDGRVFSAGERAKSALKQRICNERRHAIFTAWGDYMTSGRGFMREQLPLPKWEDFKDA